MLKCAVNKKTDLSWISQLYQRITQRLVIFVGLSILCLQGCASSEISRRSSASVDDIYLNSRSTVTEMEYSNLSDSYQNASQQAKGLIIGGLTGGIIGGFHSSIGFWPGLLGGMVVGGVVGAIVDQHTTLLDKLYNRNVNVITLGDHVLIVLSSYDIFNGRTTHIYANAYSTLDLVAQLINRYPNMSIKVSAYTNATGSDQVNLALTQKQAEAVMKHLWHRGVNTRLIYAAGYNGSHLVARNTEDWNGSDNYRIEIELEKIPI